jgi:hypothetical protein
VNCLRVVDGDLAVSVNWTPLALRFTGEAWYSMDGVQATFGLLPQIHAQCSQWSEYFKAPGIAVIGDGLATAGYSGIEVWNHGSATTLGKFQEWEGLSGGLTQMPPMSLVEYRGGLAVGGGFALVGNLAANSVAVWDGTAWKSLGSGIQEYRSGYGDYPRSPQVRALAARGDTLAAGGLFTIAGGLPANCVAVWDGARWVGTGDGVDGMVEALAFLSGGPGGGRVLRPGGRGTRLRRRAMGR